MKFTTVELYLFPLETLHCGYGIEQGVLLPSLAYIPGRVIRGGLGGWVLRNHNNLSAQDSLFQDLFYAHESDATISYPWCTFRGRLPAPLSLFELKDGGRDKRLSLVDSGLPVFIEEEESFDVKDIEGPVDFLRRADFPAQIDAAFKLCHGTVDETGNKYFPAFQTGLEMKAAHHKVTGRVQQKGEDKKGEDKKGEGGLRIEEVMLGSCLTRPEEIYYKGTLIYGEDDEIDELFKPLWTHDNDLNLPDDVLLDDPDPKHLIYIGRKSVPVAVYANESETVGIAEPPLPDNLDACLTVTLTSDCIFETPPTSESEKMRINRDTLMRQLGLNDMISEFKDMRVFCRGGQVHGYDVFKNQPASWPSIAAGSCIRFKLESEAQRRQAQARLEKLSYMGLGKHRRDGCGRFKVNWEVHHLEEGGD
ncbi:MAG: hypothetical protein J7M20_03300 [Deltaproteobacteria bacterium]|nr:hypothetical protein [Deltaproteobacteria bacterium]